MRLSPSAGQIIAPSRRHIPALSIRAFESSARRSSIIPQTRLRWSEARRTAPSGEQARTVTAEFGGRGKRKRENEGWDVSADSSSIDNLRKRSTTITTNNDKLQIRGGCRGAKRSESVRSRRRGESSYQAMRITRMRNYEKKSNYKIGSGNR